MSGQLKIKTNYHFIIYVNPIYYYETISCLTGFDISKLIEERGVIVCFFAKNLFFFANHPLG